MTVLFKKPEANPATQDRLAEVGQAFQRAAEGLRAAAPAFERRLTGIGNSLRGTGKRADG